MPDRPSPPPSPARRLAALALGLALGAAGCRQEPAPSAARPLGADELARVGDAVIPVEAFLAARARSGEAVGDAELLARLTRREQLFAEARRTGFDRTPELAAAWKAFVAERFEEAQLPGPDPGAEVEEAALAEFHARHAGRYTAPEQVHAAVLQLPLPPSAPAARRGEVVARATALRAAAGGDAATPAAFAGLAREHSQHAGSRRGGGDLGWLTRDRAAQFLPAEVVAFLFAAGPDVRLSPALVTGEGVFLVQSLARRPAQLRPLEEVRERVRREVLAARAAAAEAALLEGLRTRHPVEIHTNRLAELARPAPTLASRPPRLPAP